MNERDVLWLEISWLREEVERLRDALEKIPKMVGHVPICSGKYLEECRCGCRARLVALEALGKMKGASLRRH